MPVVESLASELSHQVRVVKVDVDPRGPVLDQFDASSVPAYILFRDGKEVDRLSRLPFFFRWRVTRMVDTAAE